MLSSDQFPHQTWGSPVGETLSSFSSLPLPSPSTLYYQYTLFQKKLHNQLAKFKLLVLKLHHFCILHGSEVTLFNEMPITRVWSYIIELVQVCARYVNGQRDQVWRTLGQQWKERQGTNSNACGKVYNMLNHNIFHKIILMISLN